MRRIVAKRDAAEIAVGALVFLAEDARRLSRFLTESGLAPDELKQSLDDPATLAAILDHLLSDESLLLVFAANASINPEEITMARDELSGRPPAWDS